MSMRIANTAKLINSLSTSYLRRGLALSIVVGLIAACGNVDYTLHSNQFTDSARKEQVLSTIYFHYGNSTEPYAVTVDRSRNGYAANAPLYQDQEMRINFSASRGGDLGNFVGMRGRLEF